MTYIASWNVNSIRARLPSVLKWLQDVHPDIVLLQETKVVDQDFPRQEIEDLGYNIAVHGQKSYNGVAILSKRPIEDVVKGLPGNHDDETARYIEAVIGDVRVASIYVPNGQEVGAQAYAYKLKFLDHLYAHAKTLLAYEEAFVLGGDYNVAPEDVDVYDPKAWKGKIHCSEPERAHIRQLEYLGLTDITRALNPADQPEGRDMYSWWNYRTRAWDRNAGLRIDLLLCSPQAADRIKASGIDTNPRNDPKASDHAPVWCRMLDEK